MSWKIIRPQIATLLSTITDIQEVANVPKIRFDGYPAAYVVPSENDADYETTKENIRTYAFIVRLFYETKQGGVGNAISSLEGIVDSVLDAFDKEDLKGMATRTLGIGLPVGYTFINVWATPSNWGELPDEQLVMAEIKVKVRVSIDVS